MNAIPSWHDLPKAWRRIAVHESAHAAVGEMCGYKVAEISLTDGVGGMVRFVRDAAPWAMIATGCAGHAAEAVMYRGLRRGVSVSDRRTVTELFDGLGGDVFAFESVEASLAYLIATDDALRECIRSIARCVVSNGGMMNRGEFCRAGAEWLYDSSFRRRVRRFCITAVREALDQDD